MVSHLLAQSPNGHEAQSWADPKPGARGFPRPSTQVQGPRHPGQAHCPPGHQEGAGLAEKRLGHQLLPTWMPAPQAEAQPTTPQHWPQCLGFTAVQFTLSQDGRSLTWLEGSPGAVRQ